MKIGDSKKPLGGVTSTRTPAKQTRTAAEKPAEHGQGTRDQVSINPLAATLHAAEAVLADTPVVDLAKVEAVRAQLERGEFAVDSGVVADRLIQNAVDSLRRQNRQRGGK